MCVCVVTVTASYLKRCLALVLYILFILTVEKQSVGLVKVFMRMGDFHSISEDRLVSWSRLLPWIIPYKYNVSLRRLLVFVPMNIDYMCIWHSVYTYNCQIKIKTTQDWTLLRHINYSWNTHLIRFTSTLFLVCHHVTQNPEVPWRPSPVEFPWILQMLLESKGSWCSG